MTNRLFSLFFAAAVTCLALALSLQRRTQMSREQRATFTGERFAGPEVNVPGFSFSKN